MFTEIGKVLLLCLMHSSYLLLTFPYYIFYSVNYGFQSGWDYRESYLFYMTVIAIGACYCFSEMIVYSAALPHIYVFSCCYLCITIAIGLELSLLYQDQLLLTTMQNIPAATHCYLQTGKSLFFLRSSDDKPDSQQQSPCSKDTPP